MFQVPRPLPAVLRSSPETRNAISAARRHLLSNPQPATPPPSSSLPANRHCSPNWWAWPPNFARHEHWWSRCRRRGCNAGLNLQRDISSPDLYFAAKSTAPTFAIPVLERSALPRPVAIEQTRWKFSGSCQLISDNLRRFRHGRRRPSQVCRHSRLLRRLPAEPSAPPRPCRRSSPRRSCSPVPTRGPRNPGYQDSLCAMRPRGQPPPT
jgi:hypothetical protein